MDYRRQTKNILTAGLLLATASAFVALAANMPLRAARWLPAERQAHALVFQPSECLLPSGDKKTRQSVAIGRSAFRTPLLLGGQAARAGLSCSSCHRNGRGNPDFMFAGLSGAPGTADVTSSLMSSHRGDGVVNPTPIPDLAGPAHTLKISRDIKNQALEKFIHGLITEEFDGPEPGEMTINGLANYVRMLSPAACKLPAEQKIQLAVYLRDARDAMQATQYAIDANDPATARLMLASARSALGMINERYDLPRLKNDQRLLHDADLELAAIQHALDDGDDDIPIRITIWLAKMPRWTKTLEHDEAFSLFNPANLVVNN